MTAAELTKNDRKKLRMLSDHWLDVHDLALSKCSNPMSRGAFEGAFARLWRLGYAERKVEDNAYWYRTPRRSGETDTLSGPQVSDAARD